LLASLEAGPFAFEADAPRTVEFVLHHQPDRRRYVLRGNKMLCTFASQPKYGYREIIKTQEGLMAFMRRYGLNLIAVENEDLWQTKPGAILRRALADPNRFHAVGAYDVRARGTKLHGLKVLVYVPVEPLGRPTAETLAIPLPGLERTIEVPLDAEGRPRLVKSRRARPVGP
jgi:hypothetical protein